LGFKSRERFLGEKYLEAPTLNLLQQPGAVLGGDDHVEEGEDLTLLWFIHKRLEI